MNREEMIEAAKAEHRKHEGYWFDAELIEQAIDEGLVDGDKVHLGGALVAHVHGSDVAMVNGDTETARMPLTALTQEQRDRMLVLKAVRTSQKGD